MKKMKCASLGVYLIVALGMSSLASAAQQCNWYGNTYPVCVGTQTDWGWENNQTCAAATYCASQPSPYGLVGQVSSSVSTSKSSVSSVVISTSSSSSSKPASTSSSASSVPTGNNERCNWYGNDYPLCATTTSGWGYENNASCISRSTCAAQPSPFGIVGGTSSSVRSSVVSSIASSVVSSAPKSSVSSSSSSISSKSSSSSVISSVKSSSSVSSIASSRSTSSALSSSSVSSGVASSVANTQTFSYAQAILTNAIDTGSAAQLNGAPSSIIWNFNVGMAGEYRVTLSWSSPLGSKPNSFVVDGVGSSQSFDSASVMTSSRTLMLNAGAHTAGLAANTGDWGYMNAHALKVEMLAGLEVTSPANFTVLPSGSNISIAYTKVGAGNLTYSINSGAAQTYTGVSPLVIPTTGDGIYRIALGMSGTTISKNLRLTVGTAAARPFITTTGTQFKAGVKPFYFNGSNQYYLMYKPEAMAKDFFDRAAGLNLNVVRTWMFCNDTITHDGVCINLKSGDNFILSKAPSARTPQEQAIIDRSFQLFDNYVALAEERNIRLVLALADQWNYFGNVDSYGGYASDTGRANFKAFITNLMNHTNTITGVKYKDDPTIMMWELSNEARINGNLPAMKTWVKDIAAHVRAVAPKQLISIGMESSFDKAGSGDSYANLRDINNDVNIDAISAHLYPTWWSMTDVQTLSNITQLSDLARDLGKPAYVGEFSWPVTEQRTTGSTTVKLNSGSSQATIDSFVATSLSQRTQYFKDWYAQAWSLRDSIGGMIGWQLSGLEWGSGSEGNCQWCSGPYGAPTGKWSGNNDGFQFYCVLNDNEYSITGLGALGTNTEGNTIHLMLHKPGCDVIKNYSLLYQGLNQ